MPFLEPAWPTNFSILKFRFPVVQSCPVQITDLERLTMHSCTTLSYGTNLFRSSAWPRNASYRETAGGSTNEAVLAKSRRFWRPRSHFPLRIDHFSSLTDSHRQQAQHASTTQQRHAQIKYRYPPRPRTNPCSAVSGCICLALFLRRPVARNAASLSSARRAEGNTIPLA